MTVGVLRRRTLLLSAGALALGARAARGQEDSWAALRRGGHVAIMRHALAPGTGDPPGFRLDDCATQRNLSAAGRTQASRVGAAFRAHDVRPTRVLSSRWCRCLETARLLDLGEVEPFAPLDSFYEDRAAGPAQTEQALAALLDLPPTETWVLVTHQVNVTALTGVYPRSGQVVVARAGPGGLSVLGRLPPPST